MVIHGKVCLSLLLMPDYLWMQIPFLSLLQADSLACPAIRNAISIACS
jgi:hypothetical protein